MQTIISIEDFQKSVEVLGIEPMNDVQNVVDAFNQIKVSDQKESHFLTSRINALVFILNNKISNTCQHQNIPISMPNICNTCHGRGFHYKLNLSTINDKCRYCRGTGIRTEPCSVCKSKGHLEITQKKGSSVVKRIVCYRCKGEKVYIFKENHLREKTIKCGKCQGKGDRERIIVIGIKSYTVCHSCKGSGKWVKKKIIMKKKNIIKEYDNPVIPKTLGDMLKRKLN